VKEKDHLKDLSVAGRTLLKQILKERMGRRGLDWSGSRVGEVAGCCECGNELSACIKCGEFLEYLRN
jgi:hypothetical protein